MSIKQWNIVLVMFLLLALSGGGFVLYQNHLSVLETEAQVERELLARASEIERVKLAEGKRLAALSQEFELFLNGFLSKVFAEAKDYKRNRRVLTGLIKPENLSVPSYVAENHSLGETALMSLRLQMDKIMSIFERAEERFKALLVQWPASRRGAIEESWAGVRDQQATLYLAYFSSEEDVLGAVQALLSFYNEKRDLIQVDMRLGLVSFEDEDDQGRYVELKARFDSLSALQAELLRQE